VADYFRLLVHISHVMRFMQQHVPIHTPPSTKLVLDWNLFRPV